MIDEAGLRKAQETLASLVRGGHHKTIIEFQKTVLEAYLETGFTRVEAFILLRDWSLTGRNAQAQL